MLYSLGLRRFPAIDILLAIAAGPSPRNGNALQYLLSNMTAHYSDFDPASFSAVAFLPASSPAGTTILAKPGEVKLPISVDADSQVFTNPACAVLGFAIAQAPISLPENASRLRIQTDPTMDRLVQAMLTLPSTDIDRARRIYEVCYSLVARLTLSTCLRGWDISDRLL